MSRSLRIGQIADDAQTRWRSKPHDSRGRDDVFVLGDIGSLENVDHLDLIVARQPALAERAEVRFGLSGESRFSRHVQPERVSGHLTPNSGPPANMKRTTQP